MYIRSVLFTHSLLEGTQGRWNLFHMLRAGLCKNLLGLSQMTFSTMPCSGQRLDPGESTSAVFAGGVNLGWQSGVSEKALVSSKSIIADWKRRLQMSSYRGTAVFVLGAMASGKSTVIETIFKKHPDFQYYAYVDTDSFMELLDGFTPEKVELYYPIAREISIYLTDWLLTENISFVAEGTCVKFLELEDYMERLKDTGYNIKVRRITSPPLETVLVRARRRKNRHLSDDLVRSIYYGSRHGIEQLFRLNENTQLFEEI